MPQYPGEGGLVLAENPPKRPLACLVEPPVFLLIVRPEQLRAHHWRRGQRHQQRHHDGQRKGNGELAKETADDAPHHQNRDENRHQRQADGNDRETDLFGAEQRCLKGRHSLLQVAGDIFDNDDGVVDDKACRDGERHER